MEEKFIVNTTCGEIQGYFNRGVIKFKGIPYADPPVGKLRFNAPVPIKPWEDILDATKYSSIAPQPPSALQDMFSGPLPISEADCLSLNIWTQSLEDKLQPVMFWIHGGAFITGSSRTTDGSRLVLRGNVVVVSINYRLGALGFLYVPDIPNTTANVGLLDMVTALRWVKENISKFGGNPENITIFGESAGASAVACLLGMPVAKGLFQKAILQSPASNISSYNPITGVLYYENLMEKLGIEKGDIETLREMPFEKIVDAQERFERIQIGIPRAGPIIDKDTLPEHPLEAVKKGYVKDIDLFVGSNLDETKLWLMWAPKGEEMTKEELTNAVNELMEISRQDESKSKEIIEIYKQLRKSSRDINDAIFSDYMFRIPAIRLAEEQSQHRANTFMYLFSWKTPLDGGRYGAMHALDISFVFNILLDKDIGIVPRKTEITQELSEKMMDTWTSFARTGNPNNTNIPKLPPYDLERRATIIFDKKVAIQYDPFGNERKSWEGII